MSDRTSPLYDGTMERTVDGGVIRFERTLEYGIRDVWDAITNPERLADWWLPFDAEITIDLRPGGEMTFVATGDEPMEMTCTILRVEAPMLLEHTHVDPGATMRWELESVDAGCVLRLTHFVTDVPSAMENGFVVGLHTSLSRLEPCLAGRPVPWDWDAFAEARARYADLGLATSAS
jgi:uncharacterized protein YndB with AHSA1/START domain